MSESLSKSAVADHQAYLQANLSALLAESWRGYSQFGRGAVIIDDREAERGSDWRDRDIAVRYYSNQQAVGSNSGWPTKEIRKLVRDYNPRKQAVCVFLLPDQLCAGYKLWSKEVTPEQAWIEADEL